MEFIQKMKKREFIEMGIKALIAIFVLFIAIILMEGMIYGIKLNGYMKYGETRVAYNVNTTAYCIEVEEDQYFVLSYTKWDKSDNASPWSAAANDLMTKEQCEQMAATGVKVVYHAPNAFTFSITGVHYVVMAVCVLAVAGFFVWRFIALNNEYSRIVENFEKTGEIEIG